MNKFMYKPKPNIGISKQNEPTFAPDIFNINNSVYPDMYAVYDKFSKLYSIPIGKFILTNGCEEALRIVLEFIKQEDLFNSEYPLFMEYPTWQLVDYLGNHILGRKRLSNKPVVYTMNFTFDELTNKVFYDDFSHDMMEKQKSVKYITRKYNNWFEHEIIDVSKYPNNIWIVDETYDQYYLNHYDEIPNHNTIVIGSFSKIACPGLRLGYVLLPEEFKPYDVDIEEWFMNERPTYISGYGAAYILSLKGPAVFRASIKPIPLNFKKSIKITEHPVYDTYVGQAPEIKFNKDTNDETAYKSTTLADGTNIYRIGAYLG